METHALERVARSLRRHVIEMTSRAGSGHPTSSLSCADIVAALFFDVMRWDPADPGARNVDQFVLSKGHAAPILWAALHEAGAIGENPLSLRRLDSSLEGHPTPENPWVKIATGSLGQGIACANGIALANRMDGIHDARIYCLLGDGECAEGSVWEAAQFASLNRLSRLVAIVDVNGLGQSCLTPYGHHSAVYARRFQAFGWETVEIDGHDMAAIVQAFQRCGEDGPTAIIARTCKGRGVSFLEGKGGWHGKALDAEETERALAELGDADIRVSVRPRRTGATHVPMPVRRSPIRVSYDRDKPVATRKGFGKALVKLGECFPDLVVLDGDVKNSTQTEFFADVFPERFVQGYIAEQNLGGTALGLAASGKIPVMATFACFLTRAGDFIRMAGHSRPRHLIFCGSHAGVSIGEDGPSQMGLEDLALFRALQHSTILYPSDAVGAERLTEQAINAEGIVYLRTTRSATPIIYDNDEPFPIGGSKTLRASDNDAFTIVAAGITVHEALAAADRLAGDGIFVRVMDAYSVRPLDTAALMDAARQTKGLVVVEDHWINGGLGDAVAMALNDASPVHRLAIREQPHSGKPAELLDRYGISAQAIERKVRELFVVIRSASPWLRRSTDRAFMSAGRV